jgi:hypothetical protein
MDWKTKSYISVSDHFVDIKDRELHKHLNKHQIEHLYVYQENNTLSKEESVTYYYLEWLMKG